MMTTPSVLLLPLECDADTSADTVSAESLNY